MTHLVVAGLIGRWSQLAPMWLIAGAAVPDLVDKPLAMLGVVELYHSVGHSGLLLIVMIPIALSGRAGLAAAVGWGSHLFLDAAHIIINGRFGDVLFLVWPLAVPVDPFNLPPGNFFMYYLWTPSFFIELIIWAVLIVVLFSEWRAGTSLTSVFWNDRNDTDGT